MRSCVAFAPSMVEGWILVRLQPDCPSASTPLLCSSNWARSAPAPRARIPFRGLVRLAGLLLRLGFNEPLRVRSASLGRRQRQLSPESSAAWHGFRPPPGRESGFAG